MKCSRCGKQNDPSNEFCGKCGLRFADVAAPAASVPESNVYCFKHRKEPTQLRCGKCEKPICYRCVVMSPAGVRCRECSRHAVTLRPMAVLHEAKLVFKRTVRAGPYVWWILFLIVSSIFGGIRGCAYMNSRGDVRDDSYQQEESPRP